MKRLRVLGVSSALGISVALAVAPLFAADRSSQQVAADGAPAQDQWRPLDTRGVLGRAELLERWQLIVWDDFRAPEPAVPGSTAAATTRLLFGAVAGGFNAGSDLARPSRNEDESRIDTDPDAP